MGRRRRAVSWWRLTPALRRGPSARDRGRRQARKMTHVARDPVMVFRFALREGDLSLAGGLAQLLRGDLLRRRLEDELVRSGKGSPPTLGALRALVQLTRALGLGSNRD